jgi:hypothetical protein
LSLEDEFWKPQSLIRRRWLIEYERLTKAFDGFALDKNMTALHIAASVGFTKLVLALLKNGHLGELNFRDEEFNTPVGSAWWQQHPIRKRSDFKTVTLRSFAGAGQHCGSVAQ